MSPALAQYPGDARSSLPDRTSAFSAPDSSEEAFIRNLVRHKARRLSRNPHFSLTDRDDIAQELELQLIRAVPNFNGDQGSWQAFVTVVVERSAAKLLRDRRARKRQPADVRSLDSSRIQVEGHSTDLAETISQSELDRHRGRSRRDREELASLQLDVSTVVRQCSADDQQLMERLMHDSMAETSRTLNVPRSTLRDRLRACRACFEQADLKQYL